ncbi:MAG: hypothetical protein U0929_05565 [Planctomycetaceae bacterium]
MSRKQLVLGIALLACGTFILCATAADPKKPAKPGKDSVPKSAPTSSDASSKKDAKKSDTEKSDAVEDQGPWEVTDRVELIYKEKLAISGDQTLSAKVQLKNKSETDLAGKLVLVIDGSTIPGSKLNQPNGQFTEATPFLVITPLKRKLESGEESAVKTVILNTKDSLAELEEDEKKDLELHWRVFSTTRPEGFETEPPAANAKVPGKNYTWGDMQQTMTVQEKFTEELLTKHKGDIVGTATAENDNGQPVIHVYATRGGMSRKIPGNLDGIPVEVIVTGHIKAGPSMSGVTFEGGKAQIAPKPNPEPETNQLPTSKSSGKTAVTPRATQSGPPTKRFTRPVPIGVSSINQTVSVCATGTLGCRCVGLNPTKLFVLSNNHVYANENAAAIGNPLCQPGPLDSNCVTTDVDVIGALYDYEVLSYDTTTNKVNLMDAAIGTTTSDKVDYQTWTPGYGVPSRFPQEAVYPGMLVQKCGRTTGYTKGKIASLNSSVIVAYDPGLARFQGCITVVSQLRTPPFGGPGDSGSLVVTQADRRPVGLLFAGGGVTTILCPISPILNRFKVGVDDGTGSVPVMGSGRMGVAIGPPKR